MKSDCKHAYIALKETGYFSSLVTDYLAGEKELSSLYQFSPDDKGLQQAIEQRKKYKTDRAALVNVIRQQYEGLEVHEAVARNIELLHSENTFTVCTAHQPNLIGGYLYFIYKIIHTVKLSRHLKAQHPEHDFVPVFYIGSEDNDFDELSVFRYNDKKYRWQDIQTGAVGRMQTDSLKALFEELFEVLGPPGENSDRLKDILNAAYQSGKTIAAATQYLVNALLGPYGVVAIDPDHALLKQLFVPVIKEELLQPKAYRLVNETSERLEHQYKAQAYARPINFFYLTDNTRERIEYDGTKWNVLNTDIAFTEPELMDAITRYPERFSPNVILRGLYQETILPNVAFIGGGSEVAYWLQLRSVFEYYKVFYPAIVLRQSALWEGHAAQQLQEKLELSDTEIFIKTDALKTRYTLQRSGKELKLEGYKKDMEALLYALKDKVNALDVSIAKSTEAALAKMQYQVNILEKKILRAEKKKQDTAMQRINRLKALLFPGGTLQERYDAFLQYYLSYGSTFFDCLLEGTVPYGDKFLVIKAV